MDHVIAAKRHATDRSLIEFFPLTTNASFVALLMGPFWTIRSSVRETVEWETDAGPQSALVIRR